MKKAAFLLSALIGVGAISLFLFWTATYEKPLLVQTSAAQLSSLQSSIRTNGKVEAVKIFELRAPFAGPCRNVLVRAGDRLSEGQLMLTIDDPALKSELSAARSEWEAAKSELSIIDRGPSREEVNQVEAEIVRLQMELESARKILETNEWLLKREAISRFEVEQQRRAAERITKSLEASTTRRNDIKARYSDADRKRADSRVEAARSKIELLEAKGVRAAIRAPASGTLYHFELKEGSYVNPGDLLGLLADLSRLRVRAFVDEPDLGHVRPGSEAVVRWDAHPDKSWKAVVEFIPSEVVTRGSRSVAEVLCTIESPREGLIPNINADIEILTAAAAQKVLTIPRSSLVLEGKLRYVWMIRDGLAVRRGIDVGRDNSMLVEVIRGISVGEQIIIPGETPIAEGMKVRVSGK